MRVITGSAKGRRLKTPAGDDVRPTAERVKEALFSIIQFDIEGRRVLDLFAGSGQLGIEALSRGAKSAVFVDSSKTSVKLTEENLSITGFTANAKVVCSDSLAWLASCRDTFDVVMLDPPYAAGLGQKLLEAVPRIVARGGIITFETPADCLPGELEGFDTSVYRYGRTWLTVYRRSGGT